MKSDFNPGPGEQSRRPEPNLKAITQRQVECLYWVEQGKSAGDTGAILGISRRTVEEHLGRACEHLRVRTKFQAARIARDLGLFDGLTP